MNWVTLIIWSLKPSKLIAYHPIPGSISPIKIDGNIWEEIQSIIGCFNINREIIWKLSSWIGSLFHYGESIKSQISSLFPYWIEAVNISLTKLIKSETLIFNPVILKSAFKFAISSGLPYVKFLSIVYKPIAQLSPHHLRLRSLVSYNYLSNSVNHSLAYTTPDDDHTAFTWSGYKYLNHATYAPG